MKSSKKKSSPHQGVSRRVLLRGAAISAAAVSGANYTLFGPMQKMAEELEPPYYEAANLLLDDSYYDNLSGQQAYKCFTCRVKKV